MNRKFYNQVRGFVGSSLVFPLAARVAARDLKDKQRRLAAEMALPAAERRASAWHRLIDTVRVAAAEVPYYRDLFARISFDPDSLARDAAYLQDIPVLTKDIIRSEGERILRRDHAEYRKFISKTGGSTGPSTHIVYDQAAADWSSAVTRYARGQIGSGGGRLELHLATKFEERFPLKDRFREYIKCLANNRVNVTFFSYAPSELNRIWSEIRAARPFLVHGHPSTLYQLAIHVAERDLPRRAFEIFESSGETLDPKQRRMIEDVFECAVINRYGLAEAGVVAYQMQAAQPAMLFFEPIAWPEVLNVGFESELPSIEGCRSGELAITTLTNAMMPLIRYRTGDIVALRETNDGSYIADIHGRIHDVVDIGGVQTPTHLIQDILDRIGGIREFQIEVAAGKPMLRIVAEPGVSTEQIQEKIAARWADLIAEFVTSDAMKLQGWRAKFRHIVTAQQPIDG